MNSGTLRHQLTFQAKTETQDSFGAPVESWTDAFTVPGAFEPLGSSEFPGVDKRYAETTARFRIRYRNDIDPDRHRIVFAMDPDASPPNESIWNIQPPLPVEGKRFELWIEASEIL
jgi:SPP1 family predicted phage head-tail adaptor